MRRSPMQFKGICNTPTRTTFVKPKGKARTLLRHPVHRPGGSRIARLRATLRRGFRDDSVLAAGGVGLHAAGIGGGFEALAFTRSGGQAAF
jgi:hypothetical protein